MASARLVAARAALLAAVLTGGACFRPTIKSGGFQCGTHGECPDNFVCDKSSHLCVSSLDGGAGGASGTGGTPGTGGRMGTGGMDAGVVCLPAVADTNCRSTGSPVDAGGMCDPVCNTGCTRCDQKCSVNTPGTETCNAPLSGAAAPLFGTCQQRMAGTPTQTDNCAAGQVCLNLTTCGYQCFQFCRGDADCSGGMSCTRDLGNGRMGCDVPSANCDPVLGVSNNGCSGGAFTSCYVSAQTERTVCDCQTANSQGGAVTDPCTRSRDCFAGLVCVNGTGLGATCYKACRLPGDGGVDQTRVDAGEQPCLTTCVPFQLSDGTVSKTYGFCR